MRYKVKGPDFTVTDGPFAGRTYRAAETYGESDIPPQEKHRFVEAGDGPQEKPKGGNKK